MKWIGDGELQEISELCDRGVIHILFTGNYGSALTDDGKIYLWKGKNVKPKLVDNLPEKVIKVTGGKDFIVVLTASQHVWFWGKYIVRALISKKHVRRRNVEKPLLLDGEYVDVEAAEGMVAAINDKHHAKIWWIAEKPSDFGISSKFKSVSIGFVLSDGFLLPYAIFIPESTSRYAGFLTFVYREGNQWIKTDFEIGSNLKITKVYTNRSNQSAFAVCSNHKFYQWDAKDTKIFHRLIHKNIGKFQGQKLAGISTSIANPFTVFENV